MFAAPIDRSQPKAILYKDLAASLCWKARRTRSEIVVPMLDGTALRGVLDVDSPDLARFDEADRGGLEGFVRTLVPSVNWASLFRT